MHYVVYLKDLDLFESLFELCGRDVARSIQALRQAVEKSSEPFEALRAWLDQKRGQVQSAAAR
jgi:hypothetical protein